MIAAREAEEKRVVDENQQADVSSHGTSAQMKNKNDDGSG